MAKMALMTTMQTAAVYGSEEANLLLAEHGGNVEGGAYRTSVTRRGFNVSRLLYMSGLPRLH